MSFLIGPTRRLRELGRALLLDEERCAACFRPFLPPFPKTGGLPVPLLCPDCRAALPRRVAGCCPLCGEPAALPEAQTTPCPACLKEAPPWEVFRFYGIYENLMRTLILRMKYRSDMPAARALGTLLLPLLRELPSCDALVPMPQHPSRLRLRGCNQCREMARPAAAYLDLPLEDALLQRSLPTTPQTRLRRGERRRDLSASFAAPDAVRGLRILLLDDTMTTGTSLRNATHCLLRAGALSVCAVVAARTALH